MSKRNAPVPAKDGRLVHEYSHDAAPLPEDARSTWSETKLKRVDAKFSAAMQREIGAKKETDD